MRHYKNMPTAFEGGLAGAAKRTATTIQHLWKMSRATANKAQRAVSKFSETLQKKTIEGVTKAYRKHQEKRRKQAIAAAKKRRAQEAKIDREFFKQLDEEREADAQRAIDQRIANGRALIRANDENRAAEIDALQRTI